jgi:hypothetical protein
MEDGIYMPIMVRRFSLVEEFADIINIPAIVESLVIVKVRS